MPDFLVLCFESYHTTLFSYLIDSISEVLLFSYSTHYPAMAKALKGFRNLEIIDSEITEDLLSQIGLVGAAQKALELKTKRRRSANITASISRVNNTVAELSSTLLEWGQLARPSAAPKFAQVFSDSVKQEMRALYNLAGEGLSYTDYTDEYVAELTSRVESIRQQLNNGNTDCEKTWVPETMEGEAQKGVFILGAKGDALPITIIEPEPRLDRSISPPPNPRDLETRETSKTLEDGDDDDDSYIPFDLLLKQEFSSNETSENGLGEDENALLGTEEDAIFGAGILMGMATLGPGQVAVKTEDEEGGLKDEGAELRDGLTEQVNGDVYMKEEGEGFLNGFQRKVIDGNTE